MTGHPRTRAERLVVSLALRRRQSQGYATGRPLRLLGPDECTSMLAQAVVVAAKHGLMGGARLLDTTPCTGQLATRWRTARRMAMYLARVHRVPDALSSRECGWSVEDIRDAVAGVRAHPAQLQLAAEIWHTMIPSWWTAGVGAPPLLAAAGRLHEAQTRSADVAVEAAARTMERARLVSIRRNLLSERLLLVAEQAEIVSVIGQVDSAITALGGSTSRAHGHRNVVELLAEHPDGLPIKVISDLTGVPLHMLRSSLASWSKPTGTVVRLRRGVYGPVANAA